VAASRPAPTSRKRSRNGADSLKLGVDVVGVAITALHPPIGPVSRAFHSQIGAVQQRETSIQIARKSAVEQLARVAGSVDLSMRIDSAIRRLDALRATGDTAQAAAVDLEIDGLLTEARGEAAEVLHKGASLPLATLRGRAGQQRPLRRRAARLPGLTGFTIAPDDSRKCSPRASPAGVNSRDRR